MCKLFLTNTTKKIEFSVFFCSVLFPINLINRQFDVEILFQRTGDSRGIERVLSRRRESKRLDAESRS